MIAKVKKQGPHDWSVAARCEACGAELEVIVSKRLGDAALQQTIGRVNASANVHKCDPARVRRR